MMEKGSRATYGRIKISDALKIIDSSCSNGGSSELITGKFRIRYRVEQKNDYGGDIFSVLSVDDEHAAVFLADVAGHDFSAAIITAPTLEAWEEKRLWSVLLYRTRVPASVTSLSPSPNRDFRSPSILSSSSFLRRPSMESTIRNEIRASLCSTET